jgi:hypothetical protein
VAIYNFKGERISDANLEQVDAACSKAGLYAVTGWFKRDLEEAYAELGETLSDFEAENWFANYSKPVQDAMREAGRIKILELAAALKPDHAKAREAEKQEGASA